MGVVASCASPWADGAAESRPRLLRSQLTRQERVSRGLGVPRRGRAEPGAGAAGTRRGGTARTRRTPAFTAEPSK